MKSLGSAKSLKQSCRGKRQNKRNKNFSLIKLLSGYRLTGEVDFQGWNMKRHARRAEREKRRRSEIKD